MGQHLGAKFKFFFVKGSGAIESTESIISHALVLVVDEMCTLKKIDDSYIALSGVKFLSF